MSSVDALYFIFLISTDNLWRGSRSYECGVRFQIRGEQPVEFQGTSRLLFAIGEGVVIIHAIQSANPVRRWDETINFPCHDKNSLFL